MWAYVFHRISGAALIVYLSMHIWVIHHIQEGQAAYDSLMRFMDKPVFRMGEAALLAAILFHCFNGVRVACMDSGFGMRNYRATFWLVFAGCAVLGIAGGMAILFLGR